MADSSEMFALSMQELHKQWVKIGPFHELFSTFLAEIVEWNHIVYGEVVIVAAITFAFTFHRYFLTLLFLKVSLIYFCYSRILFCRNYLYLGLPQCQSYYQSGIKRD